MTPAETSVGDIVLWVVALTSVIGFATTIWTIFSGPSRQNALKIEDQRKRIDMLELRVGGLEQSTKTLPTQSDMHAVSMALEGIKGEMKAMRSDMEGSKQILIRVESTVARHDNHLMKS